jgi:hypothetical protein
MVKKPAKRTVSSAAKSKSRVRRTKK